MVVAARKKNIRLHKSQAYQLYIGALIIAGLFTFMSGRLIWEAFFG